MAIVNLAASKPGAYTKDSLIVGNPDVVTNINGAVAAFPAWGSIQLAVTTGPDKRLMTVVTDTEIEILQLSATETTTVFNGQPTRIPVPSGARTSYACYLHPATVAVYVRTP